MRTNFNHPQQGKRVACPHCGAYHRKGSLRIIECVLRTNSFHDLYCPSGNTGKHHKGCLQKKTSEYALTVLSIETLNQEVLKAAENPTKYVYKV